MSNPQQQPTNPYNPQQAPAPYAYPPVGPVYPPAPGQPPYPYPVQQQPVKKSRTWLWITLVIVGAVLVCGIGSCAAFVGSVGKAVVNNQNASHKDVTLVACTKTDFGVPAVKLSITNHGSSMASYIVNVAFLTDNGSTQVDTAMAAVDDLAPGQTANPTTQAISIDSEPYDTCKITDVTRL